jgi:uncharacterized membrane-anchored protein YhcB (DUF1043 family)
LEVENIVQDHIKYDLIDDLNDMSWELVLTDGEMKVYQKIQKHLSTSPSTLENNPSDPASYFENAETLKAVHEVKVIY